MGSDWPRKRLGDLCRVKHGFAFRGEHFADFETPHLLTTPGNFSIGGGFQNDKPKYYNGPVPEEYILHAGDVIVTMTDLSKGSDTLGNAAVVPKDENIWLHNQRVGLIEFKDPSKNFPRFFSYLLRSHEYRSWIVGSATGTTVKHTSPSRILEFVCQIPALSEQKRIAHILGTLDDKIELNRRMNATLEGMAQALFKSWFVDFDPVIDNALVAGNLIPDEFADRAEIRRQALADGTANRDTAKSFPSAFQQTEAMGWVPEGWKEAMLNDLLDVKYGKDHKNLAEGGIPVYGSGGLMRYADKALYSGESVLIPRKGTLSNILYLNKKFWTVDTMFYTTPKCKYVLKYAFYHLKSLDFASLNVGSAVPSMTTKVLNALQIVMPTESVLHNFDSILTSYFDRVEKNNIQSKMLSKLRDTLLPKLISGELRIEGAETMMEDLL